MCYPAITEDYVFAVLVLFRNFGNLLLQCCSFFLGCVNILILKLVLQLVELPLVFEFPFLLKNKGLYVITYWVVLFEEFPCWFIALTIFCFCPSFIFDSLKLFINIATNYKDIIVFNTTFQVFTHRFYLITSFLVFCTV